MAATGGKPILVLPEGTQRTVGRDAKRTNITTARAICEAVRTTLGPRGMDKMLVDSLGDVTITNDGVTILDEMEIENPAAKIMVEVAKTQEDIAGDGTTSAVAIAGELLHEAARLLDKGIHPTLINAGFKMAAVKAEEILHAMSERVDFNDNAKLRRIAMTTMTGKKVEYARGKLADNVITAVRQVADKVKDRYVVDIDHIGVEKKQGGGIEDSEIVYGVIIDKEVVHPDMPKQVKNAKIALLDCPLEIEKTETDAKIHISDPEQLKEFLDEEESVLRKMVDTIKAAGANVVMCQKGIDDAAQPYLTKAGILAARRVKKSDMEKLARASNGKIITRVEDLTAGDLGYAGLVEERKIGEDRMIFVEKCKEPKAVGLLVRGGTKHVVDEAERAIHDAICAVSAAIEDCKFVAGGGASEIELAKKLREYAGTVGGREALAINAFANAVEIIPRSLIENAGLDPIDVLIELRAKHEKEGKNIGLDVFKCKPMDMVKLGIIEPLRIKIQAIKSASEAAIMILRIDDVIAAAKKEEGKPPTGPPEEAGGEEEF